ncbi:hypothetical protein DITRI_Ditri20bG0120000 [Diplodiscus trichospermus]
MKLKVEVLNKEMESLKKESESVKRDRALMDQTLRDKEKEIDQLRKDLLWHKNGLEKLNDLANKLSGLLFSAHQSQHLDLVSYWPQSSNQPGMGSGVVPNQTNEGH